MPFRTPASKADFLTKYCNTFLSALGMFLTIHYLLIDRFPELLLPWGLLIPLLIWTGLYTGLLLWQQICYPFKGQFPARLLASALLLWLLRRLLWDKDAFSLNLRQVINTFLTRYNLRSGSNLAIRFDDNLLLESSILLYLCILLMLMVLLSITLRSNKVFILPPVILLCIQLSTDKEPGIPGIFLLFLLAVYCLSAQNTAMPQKGRLLSLVLATAVLLVAMIMSYLWKDSFNDKAVKVRDFQYKMETTMKDIPLGKGLMGAQHINNAPPKYTGETVFTFTCSKVPVGNLYLRDFYATDYWNGYWSRYIKGEEKACVAAGYTKEELHEVLWNLPYEAGMRSDISTEEYSVTYPGGFGDAAHLPYGAAPAKDGHISLNGDGLWNKSRFQNTISFTAPSSNYISGPWGFQLQKYSYTVSPIMDWYNTYQAEHVLPISGQDMARRIADFLRELNSGYIPLPENRLQMAQEVATYLKSNYQYDLDPGEVPGSQDAIDYFLSTGKKGYCEHFASAGVMILRYLGVPCRYASGYIVQPSRFRPGVTTVQIQDKSAHAWVEIYLDNIGWIPVEMTPGYESIYNNVDRIPEPETDAPSEDPEDSSPTQEQQTPQQSQIPAAPQQPQEPQQTPQPQTSGNAAANGEPKEPVNGYLRYLDRLYTIATGGGADGSHTGEPLSVSETLLYTALSVLFLIPLLIALVILSVKGIRNIKLIPYIRREKRLQNCMHKRNYPAVIHFINRFFYLSLLKKHTPFDKKKGDAAYFEALTSRYSEVSAEDWERFQQIVIRSSYSVQDISKEEAQFCYTLYCTCFPLLYTGKSGQI